MTVRIPRCHLDPENPSITDPPKYGIPGVINSLSVPERPVGQITICEKSVVGFGKLGQFVSKLQENMQADIEIIVNEPNLWLSQRGYFDPCIGEYLGNNQYSGAVRNLNSDPLSRIEVTETIDYQELRYYFAPIGYIFSYNAKLQMRPTRQECIYTDGSIGCNPSCVCQENKVFECPDLQNNVNSFVYYSEGYYLYENESGQPPALVAGQLIPDIEYGNQPDVGPVWPLFSLVESACPGSPESYYYAQGIGVKPKAGCITYTTGPMPFCFITSTIDEEYCTGDFLSVTH
jgi:hypothetical protein